MGGAYKLPGWVGLHLLAAPHSSQQPGWQGWIRPSWGPCLICPPHMVDKPLTIGWPRDRQGAGWKRGKAQLALAELQGRQLGSESPGKAPGGERGGSPGKAVQGSG